MGGHQVHFLYGIQPDYILTDVGVHKIENGSDSKIKKKKNTDKSYVGRS